MKIILTAFNGKMISDEMDIPESGGTRWKMILKKPLTIISGYSGEKIGENLPFISICEFEWIGKYTMGGARIYELIDIIKH